MTEPRDKHLHALSREEQAALYLENRDTDSLAGRMGMKVIEFDEDRAVATMPVEGNTQPFGLMHGGAYVVLGESLGSMHANHLAPEGTVAVGVDVNATHTSSATSGVVTGVCTPISVGRTLAVHEIVITNEAGQRCSTVRITNFFKSIAR